MGTGWCELQRSGARARARVLTRVFRKGFAASARPPGFLKEEGDRGGGGEQLPNERRTKRKKIDMHDSRRGTGKERRGGVAWYGVVSWGTVSGGVGARGAHRETEPRGGQRDGERRVSRTGDGWTAGGAARGGRREERGERERRATLRPFDSLPFARTKGTESRSMRDERAHT